ncbi:hypothetical protein TRVA0_003S01838 [Trichomonascus vanleenenianus]|uniref:homeobox domain-containing protein n=1 Tax=Trichomonascus vanleenenianus TaxID=2268995 RepID=UPI003ECAE90E
MNTAPSLNGARPRKNNLTQQQRHKRRQRATPEQVRVLSAEFEINSTPNARKREEIGNRIDMTERSVQIWFQNKRAKTKKNTGPGFNNFGNSVAPQYRPSAAPRYVVAAGRGDALGGGIYFTGDSTSTDTTTGFLAGPSSFDIASMAPGISSIQSDNNSAAATTTATATLIAKTPFIEFPILSLTIGQWRRVSNNSEDSPDIRAMYDPVRGRLSYILRDQSNMFRIDCEFRQVDSVYLFKEEGNPNIGVLIVNMNHQFTPSFFVKQDDTAWIMSNDFTEGSQASTFTCHTITGEIDVLTENLSILHRFQPARVRQPLPTPPASSADSNATTLWAPATQSSAVETPHYTWNDITASTVSPLASPDKDTANITANSSIDGMVNHNPTLLSPTGGMDSTLLPGEDLMPPMPILTGELDLTNLDYIKADLSEELPGSAAAGILDPLNFGALLRDPLMTSNDSTPAGAANDDN